MRVLLVFIIQFHKSQKCRDCDHKNTQFLIK